MDYKQKLEQYREELEGWGFSLSSPKVPRAFSSNLPTKGSLSSNESTNQDIVPPPDWCEYSGMPSPTAYMER